MATAAPRPVTQEKSITRWAPAMAWTWFGSSTPSGPKYAMNRPRLASVTVVTQPGETRLTGSRSGSSGAAGAGNDSADAAADVNRRPGPGRPESRGPVPPTWAKAAGSSLASAALRSPSRAASLAA